MKNSPEYASSQKDLELQIDKLLHLHDFTVKELDNMDYEHHAFAEPVIL